MILVAFFCRKYKKRLWENKKKRNQMNKREEKKCSISAAED